MRCSANRGIPSLALLLLALFSLAGANRSLAQGCSVGGEGIGGTGRTPGPAVAELSGVRDVSASGDGIGGTGVSGSVGIIGTVSGLDALCVNGFELQLTDQTAIRRDGNRAPASELALGQVVRVEARGAERALVAEQIVIRSEVTGPISRWESAAEAFEVLGQQVVLGPGAVLLDARNGNADVEFGVGEFVRIYGLRDRADRIVASRVERIEPGLAEVAGTVTRIDAEGLYVGELYVRSSGQGTAVEPGGQVVATGTLRDSELLASVLAIEPERFFGGRLDRLSLEGFVRESRGARGFGLAGIEVDLSGAELPTRFAGIQPNSRVRIFGSVDPAGQLIPELVELADGGADGMRWTPLPGVSTAPPAAEPDGDVRTAAEPRADVLPIPRRVEFDRPELERFERVRSERPERPQVDRPEREELERPEPPDLERPERGERERPERPVRRERDD